MNLDLVPLMPSPGPDRSLYFFAAVAAAVLAIILVYIAVKRRELRKPIAIAAIAAVALIIGAYTFYSNEASIDYWLMTDLTYPTGDNHLDVTCQNVGNMAGTLNVKLQLTNAQLVNSTSPNYKQQNNQTATFTFKVQPGETQSARVYFNAGSNVTDFYLDLTAQSGSPLEKYNDGVTQISYQKSMDGASFNQRIQTAVP